MRYFTFSALLLSSLVAAHPNLGQRLVKSRDASSNSGDPQTSLTLVPSVIAHNYSQSGVNSQEPGVEASITSTNNFINWCTTLPNLPITNGQQLKNGSCNPAPMGAVPAVSNIPSSKFVSPENLAVVQPDTTFQIVLAIQNLATGWFSNPETNYIAAPQQLDPTTGYIQGHSHIVIEAIESLFATTPTDPTKFAFFTAMNEKADADGYLYANVTGGLPKGTYRMSSVVAAMNHQLPVLPVVQRGASDDVIYFTVLATGETTNTTTPVPTPVPSSAVPTPTSDC